MGTDPVPPSPTESRTSGDRLARSAAFAGVATLTGTVGTAAEADHAATVTRGVEGVKQVMNNIKVDPAKNKR